MTGNVLWALVLAATVLLLVDGARHDKRPMQNRNGMAGHAGVPAGIPYFTPTANLSHLPSSHHSLPYGGPPPPHAYVPTMGPHVGVPPPHHPAAFQPQWPPYGHPTAGHPHAGHFLPPVMAPCPHCGGLVGPEIFGLSGRDDDSLVSHSHWGSSSESLYSDADGSSDGGSSSEFSDSSSVSGDEHRRGSSDVDSDSDSESDSEGGMPAICQGETGRLAPSGGRYGTGQRRQAAVKLTRRREQKAPAAPKARAVKRRRVKTSLPVEGKPNAGTGGPRRVQNNKPGKQRRGGPSH